MKHYFNFIILLLLLQTTAIQAASVDLLTDTISVGELITNFRKYPVGCYADDKDLHNIIMNNPSHLAGVVESPLVSTQLIASNKLRQLCATWKIAENFKIKSGGDTEKRLYLSRLKPFGNITLDESKRLFKSIVDKYGKDTSGKLFAKWYSGKLIALEEPRMSFGLIVSQDIRIYDFSQGVCFELIDSSAKIRRGTMDIKSAMNKEGKGKIVLDGDWTDRMMCAALNLANFVNDRWDTSTIESDKEFNYSFLLFTDSAGQSTIHLLSSEQQGELNTQIVSQLKKVIPQLPKWSFGYLLTIKDKKNQGRYLKATYSVKNGWEFTDYLTIIE